MAQLDIGKLITESMIQLNEGTDISKADDYKPGEKVITTGTNSDPSKGDVEKSDSHIKEQALQAGFAAKRKFNKTYKYDTSSVIK